MTGFKTYLGIILAAIGGLAASLGVEPAALPAWTDQVFVIIGSLLAVFGRWDRERRGDAGNE